MRRAVRSFAKAAGVGGVFVGALAGGAVAHLDVPAVRRAVVSRVNGVLASVLAGKIVIDRVESLGPGRVTGAEAHVVDPAGDTVLHVTGVNGHVRLAALLRSLLAGGDVVVDLDEVSVGQADVSLDADEGTLRLARSFAPARPSAPSPEKGVGVRLSIPHGLLAHAKVHGQPPAGPPVDADVDGVDATVTVAPGTVALEVRHAAIVARGMPPGVTTRGTVDAQFAQPAPGGGAMFAHAFWSGTIGELAGTADVTYDAGRLDAVADVPATTPECVRGLWASCPFGETTSAHAEVHGALPELQVNARATVGRGAVDVVGPASLGGETRASLHVTAADIDLHAIASSAPASDLSGSGEVAFVGAEDGAAGALVAFELQPGTIDGTIVPAATLVGRLDRDARAAVHAQADVAVHETGVPLTVTARLSPKGSSFAIEFDASADVPRLDGVARIGPVARGSARAHAHGTIDLDAGRIDARVDASAASLATGGASLDSATLSGHVSGSVTAPRVDADVAGTELVAGPLRFETVHAEVHGPPAHAPVKVSLHGHGADFFAQANVDVQDGATLRDVLVSMDRDGESARGHAALVRLTARETDLQGLELEGLGSALHADVRALPGLLRVRASSRGLDLARVGRLAGLKGAGGRVAVDVDAELHATSAEGHVILDLTQGTFAGWKNADAHVDAQVTGRKAWGSLRASLGDVGTLEMSSSALQIGTGSPLEASSWRTAWGAVDVASHVDLARLMAQLPGGTVPVARVSGTVDVKGRVERDSADDTTPAVDVTASTRQLALAGNPVPWRVDGIGAKIHVHVDGNTGHTTLDGDLEDATGGLLAVAASSDAVPYAQLFAIDAPMRDSLLAMPFQATLTFPSRDIATLPSVLGLRGMHGTVEGRVDWRGAALDPAADLHATLTRGKADVALLALPLDLAIAAHYAGGHGEASVQANAFGKQVLDARTSVDVRAADLFRAEDPPWTASARAELSEFPLQSISALDNRQVRGHARGTLQVDDLHRDARASLSLAVDNLEVGDIVCRPTTVTASADGHSIDVATRIAEQDGYAEAKAHLGSRWGRALLPSPDTNQAAKVTLAAKHFRAAVLLPFVSSFLTELDGRLDGDASVEVDPVARTMKPTGTLSLSDGVFEVSAIGSELHDAAAKFTFTPDGVVRLDSFSAKGLSGRVQAAATARFQGFGLAAARATIQVPQKEPLPLVADGVQIGLIDGRMNVAVDRGKDALAVNVDVPALRLQLPVESTHDVQVLGELPGVRVGIAHGPAEFTSVNLDGEDEEDSMTKGGPRSPLQIAVKLGNVEVVRGTDLDVRLEGAPTLKIADSVTATGQIRFLPYGTLNVEGKTFRIDNGTVTFVEDPTNPQVVLTASWVADDADRTTIYADFIGPLKTGKVTLRSEPAHAQNDILSLLLYGTVDQQGAGGASGAGSQQLGAAGGIAGNAASDKINRALGGLNHALDSLGLNAGISTKLDTSQPMPRPEVEVQIARDISVQVAWVLGVPPPGSNPDTYLFTINWRFLRQWSLETTRGDAGTTILDLVWQHRY